MNRFDLEQAIMACWNTSDDVKVLSENILDGEEMTDDDISNTLIGIEHLHNLRMARLFSIFEEMIKDGKML
jgi:hypothetical protein